MRSFLSRSLHALALHSGYSLRAARKQSGAHVLMLHGIGVGGLPTKALDGHLAWLKQHFDIIALPQLADGLAGKAELPKHPLVLTFDDGLANNVTEALPLLKKHDLPATFFVCPGLIETGAWLWNHEARARLSRLGEAQAQALRTSLTAEHGAPATGDLVEWMKGLVSPDRSKVSATIRSATDDFTPTQDEERAYAPMTRETLLGLPARITIGSHTVDHPILTTLSRDEVAAQLKDSRKTLEDWLQRPVPHFCYPNGAEDPQVRELAREHYDLAVTTQPGIAQTNDTQDPHGIPRIGVVESRAELAWRLHRP